MFQNKSTMKKCGKKQKYMNLKMGFAIFFYLNILIPLCQKLIHPHMSSSILLTVDVP